MELKWQLECNYQATANLSSHKRSNIFWSSELDSSVLMPYACVKNENVIPLSRDALCNYSLLSA